MSKVSYKQYLKLKKKKTGWHKYKAIRTLVGGKSFPSRLEASVYQTLQTLLKSGKILSLKEYPVVFLTKARISYKVDFLVEYAEPKETVYVEAKGIETGEFLLKKKLWKYYGPAKLEIWKRAGDSFNITEVIPSLSKCHICGD